MNKKWHHYFRQQQKKKIVLENEMVTVTIIGDFFNSSFLLVLVTGFNGIHGAIFFNYFISEKLSMN